MGFTFGSQRKRGEFFLALGETVPSMAEIVIVSGLGNTRCEDREAMVYGKEIK